MQERARPLSMHTLSRSCDMLLVRAGARCLTMHDSTAHPFTHPFTHMSTRKHTQNPRMTCICTRRGALPEDCAALSRGAWLTRAPMLVLGSHDWNTPNAKGELPCHGKRQEAVLAAAAAGTGGAPAGVSAGDAPAGQDGSCGGGGGPQRGGGGQQSQEEGPGSSKAVAQEGSAEPGAGAGDGASEEEGAKVAGGTKEGPGALLLVPRHSTHHSFNDILLLFEPILGPVCKLVSGWLARCPVAPAPCLLLCLLC